MTIAENVKVTLFSLMNFDLGGHVRLFILQVQEHHNVTCTIDYTS